MADTKISALPASTTPLAGTEVLPIVQSSTTKQVTVANLTAGRTFEALGVTLTSTDAGATAAPLLDLYRDSASPAASDTLGEIEFNGEDSAGNKQTYGLIHASILSPTSTTEQGQLHFETATAGSLTEKMIIGTTNLVINEIGAVFNVRIEGDTDANLFYTDATNSRIGIGTLTPAQKLDVVGAIKSSDNIIQGTAAKGFNFTANTSLAGMTSQLLNKYEEGTFTPFISFGGGTTGITYFTQSGLYTRVGRVVTVSGSIYIDSKGSSTGVFELKGLPYTSNGYAVVSITYRSGVTYTGQLQAYLNASEARVTISTISAVGAETNLTNTAVAAGTQFYFSCTYHGQ